MSKSYSIYEAKARFSQVIREVRDGETVTVSHRGEPVAEIRPLSDLEPPTIEQRIADLRRSGEIAASSTPDLKLNVDLGEAALPAGTLERFLKERHREEEYD